MKPETVDLNACTWLNPPSRYELTREVAECTTDPETDFWQRTHYGFRRTTGHALLTRLWDDFSLRLHCEFVYEARFDQAGLLLYVDEDNWAKASLEYGDDKAGWLGSVVTQGGYSDWASTPVELDVNRMWYRISRRGADFRFDCSHDGDNYTQMRIFHLSGDLSAARVGLYACSPGQSSFTARFTEVIAGPCVWRE